LLHVCKTAIDNVAAIGLLIVAMVKKDVITESLELFQRAEHLTDWAMAQKLGYHETTWNRLKKGEISIKKMEIEFLLRALEAYPALIHAVNILLLENVSGHRNKLKAALINIKGNDGENI